MQKIHPFSKISTASLFRFQAEGSHLGQKDKVLNSLSSELLVGSSHGFCSKTVSRSNCEGDVGGPKTGRKKKKRFEARNQLRERPDQPAVTGPLQCCTAEST
jgi:hypothetical protein